MVTIYGLNEKIGNVTYYDSSGQAEYNFSKPYSEETARIIDEEISALIESQYQRAIQILEDNKDKLNTLADILIEKEVIFKDDLEALFGKRSFDLEADPIQDDRVQEQTTASSEDTTLTDETSTPEQ
jgi:cell division protease FtsH